MPAAKWHVFFREAILMLELPRRHAASPKGSRFAPNEVACHLRASERQAAWWLSFGWGSIFIG